MVRVTSTMLSSNYLKNVSKNLLNIQTMQSQLSTGKEISKPSDDPYKASRIVQMYADVASNEQYNANICDVTNLLDVTDSALTQMSNLLSRVRELMVSAGNAGYGSEQLQSIQDEMKVKVDQLSQIMNTSFDGKYIFGGTKVDSKPVTVVDGKLEFADNATNALKVYKDKDGNITTSAESETKAVNLTDTITGSTLTVKDKLQEELDVLDAKASLNEDETARKTELEEMIAGTVPVRQNSEGTYTTKTTEANTQINISSVNKTEVEAEITRLSAITPSTDANTARINELKGIKEQVVFYNQLKADMSVEISEGVTINYNQTAVEVLEFTDPSDPTRTISVSDLFEDIINNLGEGGDSTKIIGENLSDLDKVITNLLSKSSEVGAMQNRMESAKTQNETENYNLTSILSSIEDIDFTEKMIDFSTLMTVYQASLQVSSKILPQTIMDYL